MNFGAHSAEAGSAGWAHGVSYIAGRDGDSFLYSDGDEIETRVAGIIASAADLAIGSDQLDGAISDFPSRCHLSSCRANLLRPLRSALRGRILEVGSGCGALTRFLGETGAEIWALEGSRRRAQICRSRCRNLPNVEVICSNFRDFLPTARFDVILLVGVLEYAALYFGGDDAAASMLRRCAELLNENGVLAVAIENQLGLKYWAGAPEDHLGIPFLGIDDTYKHQGIRTYGRRDLQRMFKHAGFPAIDFLYPFPDYKFPRVIITELGFSERPSEMAALVRTCTADDYGIPFARLVSEEMAWPAVIRNNLAPMMANSFLVLAGRNARRGAVVPPDALAWHYSSGRRRCYAKESYMALAADQIRIARLRMYPSSGDAGAPYRQELHNGAWTPGHVLRDHLFEIVNRAGWSLRDLVEWSRPWLDFLRSRTAANMLPPDFIDCTPANIALTRGGELRPFDLEISAPHPVPFNRVAFRGLLFALANVRSIAEPETPFEDRRLMPLVLNILRHAGCEITDAEAALFIQQEIELQQAIVGSRAIAPEWFQTAEIAPARDPKRHMIRSV